MRLPGSRKRPYTVAEIGRRKCVRCGAVAAHQWRICAADKWTAVCVACDAEINRMVAQWAFGAAIAEELMGRYSKQFEQDRRSE